MKQLQKSLKGHITHSHPELHATISTTPEVHPTVHTTIVHTSKVEAKLEKKFKFPDDHIYPVPKSLTLMNYYKLKDFLKKDQPKVQSKTKMELDKLKIATLNGMVEKIEVN